MAVLTQTFVPGMTSAQYDATTTALLPLIENFDGFLGLHAMAVVDGGIQVIETWTNEAAYRTWIDTVVATKVPAEAIKAMKTTFTPLHNVVLTKALVSA